MREFRPSSPADAAAIAALLRESGLNPVVRPEVEQWKYWQPRADWQGDRSYVLTDHGNVIAHGAIVPGVLTWSGERARIIFVVDWAARPEALGAGVTLMKRLAGLGDGMLAVGGKPQTRQILPHLGFKPTGEVRGYVRPLRPLRLFGAGTHLGWRLLPRFARSTLWVVRAPTGGGDDLKVRRIAPNELSVVRPAFPTPTGATAVFERSEASMRHTLECPLVQMELHALERSSRVQGYFLLAVAGRQARLADCWITGQDSFDWRSLIQHAVRRAKEHPEIAEVTAWSSDALFSESLLQCGFHPRNTQPLSLMIRGSRTAPPGTLRVQMIDTDLAYLDPYAASLWA